MDKTRRELVKAGGRKRSMGFATIKLKHLSIFENKVPTLKAKLIKYKCHLQA